MKKSLVKGIILGGAVLALCLSISACGTDPASTEKQPPVSQPPAKQAEEVTSPWGGLTYTGSGVGYVIKFENGTKIYDSGDTNLFYDMKMVIGDIFQPDVAIFPIGNYFTMNDKLAAKASEWVNPKIVIPNHYNSYPMLEKSTDEFVKLIQKNKSEGKSRAEAKVLVPGKEEDLLGVKTLWFGHSTVKMTSLTGKTIVIDPWFETNPSCPAEYKDIEKIGKPDIILFTHGHIDHVNMEEITKIAEKYNPVIIAQWEMGLYLQQTLSCPVILANKGATIDKELFMKQVKDEYKGVMPEELEISMVHADHSSSK